MASSAGGSRDDDTDLRIWHASLDLGEVAANEVAESLSDDERERGSRFHFERDRRRFVAARGILRSILGATLGVEPSRVRFHYGERGKPFLDRDFNQNIRFNLAHSADHVIVAVADGAEVGVDIEAIRPIVDALAIADRFFAPSECAAVHAAPAAQQVTAFFRCWTRKEAYIKALGEGFAHPLAGFEVPVADIGSDACQIIEDGEPAADWSLRDLSELPAYAAAVVARGRPGVVHRRVWTHPPAIETTAFTP